MVRRSLASSFDLVPIQLPGEPAHGPDSHPPEDSSRSDPVVPSPGRSMRTIRVLIRDGPPMLRDILERAIAGAPDMEAVPESPLAAQEPVEPQPSQPDVVIVGAREPEPAAGVPALLKRWPGSQVLLITAHGRKAVMYQLVPHGTDMGEISPDQLVDAIRSCVRERL